MNRTAPGTWSTNAVIFFFPLGGEGKLNDGLEASSSLVVQYMFPSARMRVHEPDIGKRNQGINYRVLVTPHERYWDFSYMCTDFGSITGGRRTSGGTESSSSS